MKSGRAKASLDQLAAFGGPPLFPSQLHVGRPNIPNREALLARINDMLDRRWLTNSGPFVEQFEERIAALSGAKHAVAVCNGTLGLQLAIRALGWTGEVIVPSFTFVASAHALLYEGVTPVFCDIGERGYNLDPNKLEGMITPRTTGILAVHLFDQLCDIEAISSIARKHGLTVAYDAAHAFGSTTGDGLGEASVFSFHATKFLNSFEGGAIVTNSVAVAEKLRCLRNFGFDGEDNVTMLGTNAKMSEIAAAMGLTSLESLESIVDVNRAHYEQYCRELHTVPGLTLLRQEGLQRHNYQYVVAEVDEADAGLTRDELHYLLTQEGARVRRYFYPGCHRSQPYRTMFPDAAASLPQTERAAARVLVLPTGTGISSDEITELCSFIHFLVANSKQVSSRLRQRISRKAGASS